MDLLSRGLPRVSGNRIAKSCGEMNGRLAIVVDGIAAPALVAQIEKAIRDSFNEMSLPGSWRVIVRPSCVIGHWDFSVQGLDARHTGCIAVPPALLPCLIPRRLCEALGHLGYGHLSRGVVHSLGDGTGRDGTKR